MKKMVWLSVVVASPFTELDDYNWELSGGTRAETTKLLYIILKNRGGIVE